MTTNEHVITHQKCEKTAAIGIRGIDPAQLVDHPMCVRCKNFGRDKSLIRNIQKFFVKYMAARFLSVLDEGGSAEPMLA